MSKIDKINNLYSIETQIKYLKDFNKEYMSYPPPKIDYTKQILKSCRKYPNVKSRKQFHTLINKYIKNDDIHTLARTVLLIQSVLRVKNIVKILDILLDTKNKKDGDYYKKLRKLSKNENKSKDLNKKIVSLPLQIFVMTQKYIFKEKYIIKNILDIGCGNCKKIEELGSYFKLNKEHIFGTDFEKEWFSYKKKKNKITFVPLEINKKLNFDDNVFDLVSCMHVLHHMSDFHIKLQEINRITKMNGLFILVEHDTLVDVDHMLADIEHLLYEEVLNDNKNYYKDHYSHYFNYMEVDLLMKENGFMFQNYSFYDKGNKQEHITPTRSFIGIYRKYKNL